MKPARPGSLYDGDVSSDHGPSAAPTDRDEWSACLDAPLDPAAVADWIVVPSGGASVTFTGTVRDHADGRRDVHLLEYEAYEEQVVAVFDGIIAEARRRWPDLLRIAVVHRVGALQLTDTAVIVAVSSPHRDPAFDAGRWILDEVKARAPIWKREHHADGVDWGRCDHRSVDHARTWGELRAEEAMR